MLCQTLYAILRMFCVNTVEWNDISKCYCTTCTCLFPRQPSGIALSALSRICSQPTELYSVFVVSRIISSHCCLCNLAVHGCQYSLLHPE